VWLVVRLVTSCSWLKSEIREARSWLLSDKFVINLAQSFEITSLAPMHLRLRLLPTRISISLQIYGSLQ